MPRQLRIGYSGAIYQVMNRGERREPIFRDDVGQRIADGHLDACGEPAAKREG